MEAITRILFEQPYVQAMIAAAALAVALAGWRWTRREGSNSRPWAYAIVIILAAAIAGQFIQWAVVTDREQIRSWTTAQSPWRRATSGR